jgi:hypothetical protein
MFHITRWPLKANKAPPLLSQVRSSHFSPHKVSKPTTASAIPTACDANDRKPNIKLDIGGRSVEFEWKLPESHFTDEQEAEVQANDRNSSTRYSAYHTTQRWTGCTRRVRSPSTDSSAERVKPWPSTSSARASPTTQSQRFNILTNKTVYYFRSPNIVASSHI